MFNRDRRLLTTDGIGFQREKEKQKHILIFVDRLCEDIHLNVFTRVVLRCVKTKKNPLGRERKVSPHQWEQNKLLN